MNGRVNVRDIIQGRGRGIGSSRGKNYSGATHKHKWICDTLGNHIFKYGQKASVDQINTIWDKLVHHVGTMHVHDISNDFHNKKTVIFLKPVHTQTVFDEQILAT